MHCIKESETNTKKGLISQLLSEFPSIVLSVFLFPFCFHPIRIDFSKDNPSPTPGDITTSETLKMVRDMDEHKDMYSSHNPPGTLSMVTFTLTLLYIDVLGYEMESAPSHVTGLSNANVQSASFKMLQRALDMDEDLSQFHGSARAPRVNQGGDK